nr:hypothetical protein [Tanacetum cinerariifolium]
MQGAFLTQGTVSSIPTIFSWGGSIGPEGLQPSVLLLTVIIVTVDIVVTVVLVIVDMIIGIIVVVGVPSIIKLAFVITAGSESHPPMLNKENYVPWSSPLLRMSGISYSACSSEPENLEYWKSEWNEEARIQLQAKEFDLIEAPADLDEIEEVNANCILMANLQQASTSGTQTDKAPVYDSDGSAEVYNYENCDDNEIFNMFTQKEQYTELLEPIPEPHQVPQNDNNVISEVTSVEKNRGTVEQHSANVEETRALYDSSYHNLAVEVEKVNTEAAKFVGDFKSLAKEADESLAKHKALELEIERLLREVVSQDTMSVVQKASVVDTSNLQTELERMKDRFKNCIIKKENEYAKLGNDWYKKCDECKFDKISYDKAYNDMEQNIEQLQAQLGDLKGKSKDTSCVSDTLNPLSQKLENENVELEFQVLNYAKENAHLKTTYKNLFDSISVSCTQTKTIISSLQNQLHNSIYKNAKLRAQLFNKVSDQNDNKRGTSTNTKFAKQSIVENLPMLGETHALSKQSLQTRFPHYKNLKIDNTKTRRPHPRSNIQNDRVLSASKSSRSKNKEVEVEEHHRNLQLSKNTKHMSSACNNIKLDSQNVISKVVCAMSSRLRIVPQELVPSPGAGHMVVNTLGWLERKESGPSPGEGHGIPPSFPNPPGWLAEKESRPSPGEGHGVPPSVPNPPGWLEQKESRPSPGEGHGVPPSVPNPPGWLTQKKSGPSKGHDVPPGVPNPPSWLAQKKSRPSPSGEGHRVPNPPGWLLQKESGPSPLGEGHKVPNPPGWLVDMPQKISGPSPRGKGHDVPPGAPGGGRS